MKRATITATLRAHDPWVVALSLLTLLVPFHPASAQEAIRDGFNFSIGAGTASVGATCASCGSDFFEDRIGGFSGTLRMGAAVTPRLVLGAEGMGWFNNSDDIYRRVAAASVVLLGYPSATSGFFVKSGFGVLRAIAEDDVLRLQSDAYVSQLGVGMDFRIGEGVSVTGYLNYLRTFGTATWANGISSPEPVSPNALQIGTAITVH